MANPTTLVTTEASAPMDAVFEATSTVGSVTLDPNREYSVGHNGVDTSGAAATDTIFMSNNADAVTGAANFAAASNKFPLLNGYTRIVGPRVSTLYFITASGSPTFRVSAAPSYHGAF